MLKIKNNLELNYKYENIIFNKTESRPSKSVIDCNLYREFIKIYNLQCLEHPLHISECEKPIETIILKQIFLLFFNKKKYPFDFNDLSISFNNIIINEIESDKESITNVIFNIRYEVKKGTEEINNSFSLINIIKLFYDITFELKKNDFLIFSFTNLFTYTSCELLLIISKLFKKIKIFYSEILNQNIIIGYYYIHDSNTILFLKQINNQLKNITKPIEFIRQFGIFIDNTILNNIKNFNTFIFNKYIQKLKRLTISSNPETSEQLTNKIILKNLNLIKINNTNYSDCPHQIIFNSFYNCYVCKKCFELFNYHI